MAERYPTAGKVVDWGAIVAGFIVAFVIFVLLSLIVAMIGGGVVNPVAVGIISFVSLLCGGWVSGYLAPYNGLLHGTLTAVLSVSLMVLMGVIASVVVTLAVPAIPSFAACATALFIYFILQLIGGAIGGYIADLTTVRAIART